MVDYTISNIKIFVFTLFITRANSIISLICLLWELQYAHKIALVDNFANSILEKINIIYLIARAYIIIFENSTAICILCVRKNIMIQATFQSMKWLQYCLNFEDMFGQSSFYSFNWLLRTQVQIKLLDAYVNFGSDPSVWLT